jgi:DNA-binding FrmR family transcriptional regulator
MQPEQQAEIMRRLRSAQGHLGAVIGMVESGESCEQVLHQLGAVQAALLVAGARLLACQVETSKIIIQLSPCPEERAAELDRLSDLYQIMMKSSKYNRK